MLRSCYHRSPVNILALIPMSLSSRFKAAKVISFDVFDTLLLRNTKPEIVRFREIAHLWAQEAGGQVAAEDLFHSRLLAARICYRVIRKNMGCREAKHSEILRVVCEINGLDASFSKAFGQCELEYEKQSLSINKELLFLIEQAISENKPVFAISDMYFSSNEIQELICNFAPTLDKLNVYSSSDVTLNKASGELYKHVSLQEGISLNEDWLHIGDNHNSDVVKATHAGIAAAFTPRGRVWRTISNVRKINSYVHHKVGSL